ncbi:hypothetical protein [Desulfonauticus submarinus]
MVTPIDLPVLFSQIPQLQKLQHSSQAYPEGAQNVLADVVIQKQKEDNKRILKPEKTEKQEKISPDKEKDAHANYYMSKKHKEKEKNQQEIIEDEKKHIIDIKI